MEMAGVDVSPIADLYKTEVYELAKGLNLIKSIQEAIPTDGLWDTEKNR
jgi:NAD+ synthase